MSRSAAPVASRLQILAAAILFSTGGAAIKSVTLSSWQVASFRSGVAALALLILLPAARRCWNWRSAAVGLAYALTLILYALANKLTTAANTIFLQSTAPLYIVVLGPWLLKERIRRRDLIFLLVMATGLGLFFIEAGPSAATAPEPLKGNLMAAAAGVSWALAVVGLRWMSRSQRVDSGSAASAVVMGNLIAFAICLPKALPLGASPALDWWLVLYLGVVQVGLAYIFLTAGLKGVPAFEASLLLLLEPVLNPVWAWLVHGEIPAVSALAGGGVILAATTVRSWFESRSGPC